MANGKKTSGRRSSKYEAPKQRRITKQQIENATYKDVKLLEKFVSDRGKIRSSLITGITKQEQAKVARLIKVARELALLPYCLLYTSPSPRDGTSSRMPSSA